MMQNMIKELGQESLNNFGSLKFALMILFMILSILKRKFSSIANCVIDHFFYNKDI